MISTAGLGQAEGTRVEFSGGSSADVIGIFYIEMTPSDQRERTGTEILEEIRERVSWFQWGCYRSCSYFRSTHSRKTDSSTVHFSRSRSSDSCGGKSERLYAERGRRSKRS